MGRLYAVVMVIGLAGCAFDEDFMVGQTDHPVVTRSLGADLLLDCGNSDKKIMYSTSFYIPMTAGDTVLVGGDVLMEYSHYGYSSDELAETRLACRPGHVISAEPSASAQLSRTGQNLWQTAGDGNISDAHGTRGIYTAATTEDHVCWLIYQCMPVNEGPGDGDFWITARDTSTIHYYEPNAYPGNSWKLETNSAITSLTATTVQNELWDAERMTSTDDEVVVRWSPHVTTCLDKDNDSGAICDGLQGGFLNTGFEWRVIVRQYNGITLCNNATGEWTYETCGERDHHCDIKVLTSVFPIVLGSGTHGACGTALTSRRFRITAQMRKVNDSVYANDLVVSGSPGNPYTNLTVYSR